MTPVGASDAPLAKARRGPKQRFGPLSSVAKDTAATVRRLRINRAIPTLLLAALGLSFAVNVLLVGSIAATRVRRPTVGSQPGSKTKDTLLGAMRGTINTADGAQLPVVMSVVPSADGGAEGSPLRSAFVALLSSAAQLLQLVAREALLGAAHITLLAAPGAALLTVALVERCSRGGLVACAAVFAALGIGAMLDLDGARYWLWRWGLAALLMIGRWTVSDASTQRAAVRVATWSPHGTR